MNKRGQVTIFVVLGILIVIVIGIVVLIRTNSLNKAGESGLGTSISLSQSIDEINSFVNLCLTEFSDSAIYDAGKHAGYALIKPENYFGLPNNGFGSSNHPIFGKVVYLTCNGVDQTPNILNVETNIEEALEYYLINECLDEFNILRDNGWNVEGEEFDVNINMENSGIFVTLNIPRKFDKNEISFEISNFDYFSGIDFNFYLVKSKEIVDSITNLLISILPELELKVNRGELTVGAATEIAINEVEELLETYRIELDSLGYDFFYAMDFNPPDECNNFPKIFLIKNRENKFRYVFGASL